MTEREIFLAILELPKKDRAEYLDNVCQDPAQRARIEALLHSHENAGSFLGIPAVDSSKLEEATQEFKGVLPGNHHDTELVLDFLNPSTRPGSLGRLEPYEILQVLGQGGFGIVFRAFDEILQRVVAIKVMAPQLAVTSPARKRFLREARTLAGVRHENVIQVYQVAEQPLPFLVMEYIPGENLQQLLDRVGPVDVFEVLRIGRQIAEGLAAAHAADLIHRDVKPANVLIEGAQRKVKLTDFGLARTVDDASMSQSGMIAGTPMYMAPEQTLGKTLDQRADLFSLGSVLYQMATGHPPFRANNTIAVLRRVAEDTPRPIREIIPETPQWLCDVITKLHAKNPADRFQTSREVADLLADCEEQMKKNSKLQDFSRIPKLKPISTGKWIGITLGVVILLPLLTWGVYWATRPAQPIEVAQRPNQATVNPEPKKMDPPIPDIKNRPEGWRWLPKDAPEPAIAPFDVDRAKKLQEEWAAYLKLPIEYTNSIGMRFRLIPPGEFMMGSTPAEIVATLAPISNNVLRDQISNEGPRHKVILTRPFYLGIHEVTQTDYEKMMGVNPSHFSSGGAGKNAVTGIDSSKHPVENVSYNDACAFCNKLGERDQLTPCYRFVDNLMQYIDGTSYRLPTEGQWEFCCRAGTTTKYEKGNQDEDILPVAWIDKNSAGRTHRVGELTSNPFGIHDILGNVSEWVQDHWLNNSYASYQNKPAIDPTGQPWNHDFWLRNIRVIRGGNWNSEPFLSRSSHRANNTALSTSMNLGFRISLPIETVWKTLNPTASPLSYDPSTTIDFNSPAFQQWIQATSELPVPKQLEAVVEKLKELNPRFDGKVKPTLENGLVKRLDFDCSHVSDLSPLRALVGFTELDISALEATFRLRDLSPLKGFPLTRLLCNQTGISNLNPLRGMPLKQVSCGLTPVKDLEPFRETAIESLGIHWTQVNSLTALQGTHLSQLFCFASDISDLTPLKEMNSLTYLHIAQTRVSDLTPLKKLRLKDLHCATTLVKDLEPLRGMKLVAIECQWTEVTDLSPLEGMPLWMVVFTPAKIRNGIEILRQAPTMNRIGATYQRATNPKDFWKRYDAGEFGKPKVDDAK